MDGKNCEELFSSFRHTAGCMRRELTELKTGVGGAGFQRGQGRLMRLLLSRGGVSQKELAAEMDIRPASLSELLVKLESKGLVAREQNKTDKRVMNLRLTEAGQKQATALEEAKAEYARRLFSALDNEESAQLSVILAKLDKRMAQMEENA